MNIYQAIGVGVIFGASTKKLLFIGVRNKYIALFVPSVNVSTHHLHLISVIAIGMVLHVPWRQILLLKVSNFQNRCMELDTYGSLKMVTVLYTMQ